MVKVALVTGSGHRLGRALALGLGAAGYSVAVHYRSRKEQADETLRLLRGAGADGEAFREDLGADGAAARLVESVLLCFGRLDALVHSASPWSEKPVAEVTLEDWEAAFRVGPRAAFFLAQASAPALREARGAILLISDVAAVKAWPHHIPHSAAKAAVNSLVAGLAVALGPEVRVNGLAPGIVLPPDDMPEATVDRLVQRTPLKRPVEVADVVSTALALLANGSVTGQVWAVDAGRTVI